VTVLPIPLARRAAATACAAVHWGSRERLSWRPAHADDPPPRVDYGTASVEGGLISYGASLADGYR
jgi:hypothetical protein